MTAEPPPTFLPRADIVEGQRPVIVFACVHCGTMGAVDAGTGACRACWRGLVLWPWYWERARAGGGR